MLSTAVASAPARCGILGNPSDIYGGKVLSCSVPARATCRVIYSESNQLPEDLRLWKATIDNFPLPGAVQVEWTTDIPRSSGLSGSTALLAATIAAVRTLRGDNVSLDTDENMADFAELLRRIERYDAGVMCGFQDAYMISFGGLRLMNFEGKHPKEPGPKATLRAVDAPLPFLLVTTGVERLSGSVHGPMAERWMAGEPVVRNAINKISTFAEPGAELLAAGKLTELGEIMDENQRLIAEMGGSGDAVDQLIAVCKEEGAIAAKLAGAGMGGTIIALNENPDELESRLRTRRYTRFLRPAIVDGVRIES